MSKPATTLDVVLDDAAAALERVQRCRRSLARYLDLAPDTTLDDIGAHIERIRALAKDGDVDVDRGHA